MPAAQGRCPNNPRSLTQAPPQASVVGLAARSRFLCHDLRWLLGWGLAQAGDLVGLEEVGDGSHMDGTLDRCPLSALPSLSSVNSDFWDAAAALGIFPSGPAWRSAAT